MKMVKRSPLLIFTIFLFFCVVQSQETSENPFAKSGEIILTGNRSLRNVYASDNDTNIYFSDNQGTLYSYDLKTKQQNWATDLGGEIKTIYTNSTNFGSTLFTVSTNYSDSRNEEDSEITHIKFISKNSGIPYKSHKISHKINTGREIFLIEPEKSKLFAVTANTCFSIYDEIQEQFTDKGCVKKEISLEPFFSKYQDELFIVSHGELIKVTLGQIPEGKTIFNNKADITSFSTDEDRVFIGDQKGSLQVYEKKNMNALWSFRSGGKISDILIRGDSVIIASYDGFLYCFEAKNGKRLWKKRFPGRIEKITAFGRNSMIIQTGYTADLFFLDIASGDVSDIIYITAEEAVKLKPLDTEDFLIIPKRNSLDIYSKH